MNLLVTSCVCGKGPGDSPFTDDEDFGNRMWEESRLVQSEDHFRMGFWNCGSIPLTPDL